MMLFGVKGGRDSMAHLILVLLLLYVLQCCECIPPPIPGHGFTIQAVNTNITDDDDLGRAVCKSRFITADGKVHKSDPSGYRLRVDATCGTSEYALNLGATTLQRMTASMPGAIFKRLVSSATVGIFTARETLCIYPSYYAYRSPAGCASSCYGYCRRSCTFDGRKYCSLAGAGGKRTVILDDNILCNSRDPYRRTANILVHEFAHTVHQYGLDSYAKSKISRAFAAARSRRTWYDRYAMATVYEYFAVASSVFFNADHIIEGNGGPHMNKCGSYVCKTESAAKYNLYSRDPSLFSIVSQTYSPDNPNKLFNIGVCTKV